MEENHYRIINTIIDIDSLDRFVLSFKYPSCCFFVHRLGNRSQDILGIDSVMT